MAKSPKAKRKKLPKTVLKLPDLEHSKSAVLSNLSAVVHNSMPTSRYQSRQLPRSPFRDRFPASNLPRSMSVMAILRQSTLPVLQLGQTVGDGVVSNTTLREPTTLFDFKVQGLGLV